MKSDNIHTFSLSKEKLSYNVNIIKISNENTISILVENDSFKSYSTKIATKNIVNEEKKELDLLDYFYKKKSFIQEEEEGNSFIIIGINLIENFSIKEDKGLIDIKIDNDKKIIYITIKKNEYYVLWRDPNFEGDNPYLEGLKKSASLCIEEANLVVHCFTSTEKALKFVSRRINDKIIFITSIRKDFSGKRFIEIVREMYGFDIIVLFYSDNISHFEWIKDFPNCLFTDDDILYLEYIKNYKKEKLKDLKKKCEFKYKCELKVFNDDCLKYTDSKQLFALKINPNIRHVKICSAANSQYLHMSEKGEIGECTDSCDSCIWDITISTKEKTITFFSKGYYLAENNENVNGMKDMCIWRYEVVDESASTYYFICRRNNYFLSIEKSKIIVKKSKSKQEKNEIFHLLDFPEKFKDKDLLSLSSGSSLMNKIEDLKSSIDISLEKENSYSISSNS